MKQKDIYDDFKLKKALGLHCLCEIFPQFKFYFSYE